MCDFKFKVVVINQFSVSATVHLFSATPFLPQLETWLRSLVQRYPFLTVLEIAGILGGYLLRFSLCV